MFSQQTKTHRSFVSFTLLLCSFGADAIDGDSVIMNLTHPQSISIISPTQVGTLNQQLTETDVVADGSATFKSRDVNGYYDGSTLGVWGVVTNGRFSVSFTNDFSSIIDDNGTPDDESDDFSMFGNNPLIKDDFGATVNWPAFVKWETGADGNRMDTANQEQYEVLPAKFGITIMNIGGISGSDTMTTSKESDNFKAVQQWFTGQEIINTEAGNNNFEDVIGNIKVADQLGATGATHEYHYNDDPATFAHNDAKAFTVPDHFVMVVITPFKDSAEENVQPGDYYAGIKLTVAALD